MIDTIKDEELRIKQEDLLKNMKMLRHTVLDMFGSKSFFKGLIPEPHNGVITVNEEQFPVYISANTLNIDSHPDITDDIFDTENYLSLLTDDDLMWYALVEHLAHQVELLQEDNNKYNDDLVKANEEIDNLNCKVAEEIKARRGYEESLNQLREELTAADNEIEGLEESLMEANKKCTEYVKEIDKLAIDNMRLSERVKTLVIDKTNRPDTAEKVSDPDDITSDAITSQSRMETAYTMRTLELLNKITELENEIETAQEENNNLKEELKKKNEINDTNAESLEFYQKNCREFALKNKDLETEIENLKNENADFENVAEAHLETTAKFADYKERQKRLYKHFKNLAEMIEDLMELG